MVNEYEMSVYMQEMVSYADQAAGEQKIATIRHFMEANLLSKNMGLVITLQDGSEFQVTIVQTKLAEKE